MMFEIFFLVLLFCEIVREGWRPQNWGGKIGGEKAIKGATREEVRGEKRK
jgi:hypothetical protein